MCVCVCVCVCEWENYYLLDYTQSSGSGDREHNWNNILINQAGLLMFIPSTRVLGYPLSFLKLYLHTA